MRFLIVAGALMLVPAAFAQQAEIASCARTEADGARTLCHETVVSADAATVWALWTTSEGVASWMAPMATADLRIGGMMEASYDPDAQPGDPGNIRNRIASYAPERMLAIEIAQAPPDFPHAEEARRLWTVIAFEPVDAASTRVRVLMLGFGAGEAFDALYAFFDQGNAFTLAALNRRVAEGPTDWRDAAGGAP